MSKEALEQPTSPWDCPVHGPMLEDFMVGFIVATDLERVKIGDDENNIRVAEDISRVKSIDSFLAVRLVCERLTDLEQIRDDQLLS